MENKLILFIGIIACGFAGCKKSSDINNNPQDSTTKPVKHKTKVYLVDTVTIKFLDAPLPSSQMHTFKYNSSLQLVQHKLTVKNAAADYVNTYSLKYQGDKLFEVDRAKSQVYNWDKASYTYSQKKVNIIFTYTDRKDTLLVTLNGKGFPEKISHGKYYYSFEYDATGNITSRIEYSEDAPTKVILSESYTYDNKFSPFTALRDNYYIAYEAFDISTNFNNRKSDNLERYGITYNADGYPTEIDYYHGPVIVRTVTYSYLVKMY